MQIPLTVSDFLDRAELVYRDRAAIIDEPDQPAPSWGTLTYGELARRARAQAAALDRLGVEAGARVAVVSHNSARLLASFFGVSGYGRVLVPINFRLRAEEVAYIVEHSGAEVLLVDPEVEDSLKGVSARHRFVIGEGCDAEFFSGDHDPVRHAVGENDTATINYTSGTTARPKGVQLTHRNLWLNSVLMGLHLGVSERDVYLHTLPMFHANGWGMPYVVTGLGAGQVVLRKVDGAEILRRIDEHGVTLLNGAPTVIAMVLAAA
ncbi:MAG: AMP-binding protein, partial [Catenulispora sp.]|nr:AMP-binding protein [Catenulispora sp.]